MTDSILKMVQSIENDYGMNCKLWPKNDARLKKLHEWYLKHPEGRRRNLSETDLLIIQELLDAQMPKKTICEKFEISSGCLTHDIEMGLLDDTKWKTVRRVKNELRKNL